MYNRAYGTEIFIRMHAYLTYNAFIYVNKPAVNLLDSMSSKMYVFVKRLLYLIMKDCSFNFAIITRAKLARGKPPQRFSGHFHVQDQLTRRLDTHVSSLQWSHHSYLLRESLHAPVEIHKLGAGLNEPHLLKQTTSRDHENNSMGVVYIIAVCVFYVQYVLVYVYVYV